MIDENIVRTYTHTLMTMTIIAIGAIAYPIYGFVSSIVAIMISLICISAIRYSFK